MMLALDYLGGASYGSLIVKHHPPGWGAGFILNTNKPHWPKSNAWPVIEKLAATGNCPRIRVHAVWDDDHKYNPKVHDPIIFRELAHAVAVQAKYPNVEIQYSFFCEHNIQGKELRALWKRLCDNCGDITLVNSFYKGDMITSAIHLNEVHGDHLKPTGSYNYSFDGTNCVDANVEGSINKMCSHFYVAS